MQLRNYQTNIIENIKRSWSEGKQNILAQLPTGAGKTVIFTEIMATHNKPAIAIAHRVELVSQISLALARRSIYHNIIAQTKSIREIVNLHMREFGKSFYDPLSQIRVAGVDTLLKWKDRRLFDDITLIVQDEAHHVLRCNKWGKAAEMFPTALGLYPTATPVRADGKGLGRDADGLIDEMIVGPSMRHLIHEGFLTEYRIFAPPSDLDLSDVTISASGDFTPEKLRNAVKRSHITGDVVSHYLKIAKGKLGVTFAVGIEAAAEISQQFNEAGVPSAIITGKTPDGLRADTMNRFKNREILQLVNVDILGEGVDVPAIEVVSFARPTQSYALFAQQFGRALRPLPGKDYAIIIDHVGNTFRHGLPDAAREWSLDRRERRAKKSTEGSLKNCIKCLGVYKIGVRECPYCGHYTPPMQRDTVQQVEGDLTELNAGVLARMRGDLEKKDGPLHIPHGIPKVAQLKLKKDYFKRREAQQDLRNCISLWAGHLTAQGVSDSNIYRKFYSQFNIDVLTAQTLNALAATELTHLIQQDIDKWNLAIGQKNGTYPPKL